jgi:hypothetical protein
MHERDTRRRRRRRRRADTRIIFILISRRMPSLFKAWVHFKPEQYPFVL